MSLGNINANMQHFPTSNEALEILGHICALYDLGPERDLRQIMMWTKTVISGSWGLLAFFPDAFVPGDLDFYTAGSEANRLDMLLPFLEFHGYRIVSSVDAKYVSELEPDATEIETVFKLTNDSTFINIIVSRSRSEIRPIFQFHSTVVMNFIACFGVVSLYPELTMRRRGLINHEVILPRVAECITKYRERGFDLQTSLGHWDVTRGHICGSDPNCPGTLRHLHGPSVLCIPFREVFNNLTVFLGDEDWRLRIGCN